MRFRVDCQVSFCSQSDLAKSWNVLFLEYWNVGRMEYSGWQVRRQWSSLFQHSTIPSFLLISWRSFDDHHGIHDLPAARQLLLNPLVLHGVLHQQTAVLLKEVEGQEPGLGVNLGAKLLRQFTERLAAFDLVNDAGVVRLG